jgi:HEPN domain-containing protein
MKFVSGEWLKSAKDDLDTIVEILDNESLTHIVAFHSQQCVEKSFKAVIEEYELAAQRIHNLVTLRGIISYVHDFDFDEDKLALLNKLYIDSRYPGDLGLLPEGKPSSEDARSFYEFADKT